MKTFIALLRGINVGGKNKISMPELKIAFQNKGFEDVLTYINSGNIIFKANETNKDILREQCEGLIKETFELTIPVNIVAGEELIEAMQHVPSWWNVDPNEKHNAIFVLHPMSSEEVYKQVGDIKPEYEKVDYYDNIIFWSAPLSTFSRSRWSQVVKTSAYKHITIRNANTTMKLLELVQRER